MRIKFTSAVMLLLLHVITVQSQQLSFEIKGYNATVHQYDFTIAEIAFDSAGARHGSIKQKYVYKRDTVLLFAGKYEHGRLVDTARWYDVNGNCIRQGSFASSGFISSIAEYNGNRMGLTGTPEGEWLEWETIFSVKPVLVKKENYQNGKLNGIQYYYSSTGALSNRLTYVNGKPEGFAVYYFDNGKVSLEGNYANGYRTGQWYKYNRKSKLTDSYSYRDDKLEGTTFSYFPNGKIKTKSIYKDGLQQGDEWEYDSLGMKQVYRHFTNNVQDSLEIHFYPDGKISEKLHFSYGVKNGMAREYYPNEKLKAEGLYRNNRRVGIWNFIGPTGKLLTKKDYDKNPETWIDGDDEAAPEAMMPGPEFEYRIVDQLPQFNFTATAHLIPKDQKMKFLLKYEYIDVIANVDAAGNLFFTILTPMKEEQKTKLNKYLNQTFPKASPANLLGRKTLSQTTMRIRVSK